MPLTLASTTDKLEIYRDSQLTSLLSQLEWDNPITMGVTDRGARAANLVPDGSFETEASYLAQQMLGLAPAVYYPLEEFEGTVAADYSTSSRNGVYKNGPTLAAKGFSGGQAPSFDGTNDYVDTEWLNRTNLLFTPTPEVSLGKWGTGAGFWTNTANISRTQLGETAIPGLGWCVKVETTGAASAEGAKQDAIPVTKGLTYTVSVYAKGSVGGEKVRLGMGNAVVGSAFTDVTLTNTWVRYSFKFTATETGTATVSVAVPIGQTLTQIWWFAGALVEQTSELRSYFPYPAQLASGEAGWSGTEYESESDIGPFARGTTRTFSWMARRDSEGTDDAFFSSSNNKVIFSVYGSSSGSMHFTPNDWANATDWGSGNMTLGKDYHIVFEWVVGVSVTLYINNKLIWETKAQIGAPGGGTTLLISNPSIDKFHEYAFQGGLGHFAVFMRGLNAGERTRLYETMTREKLFAPEAGFVYSRDGDESTSGRSSLRASPKVTAKPRLGLGSNKRLIAVPRRKHSVGASVTNESATDKRFRLDMILNGKTYAGEVVTIAAGETERLEQTQMADYAPTMTTDPQGQSSYATRINFSLVGLDNHLLTEDFLVDELFVGPGDFARFDSKPAYRVGSVVYGAPVKLWCRNKSAGAITNVRVQLQGPALDGPRPWIEASPDPDASAWVSARLKPVVVRTASLGSGSAFSFFVRPVMDQSIWDDEHWMQLVMATD